MVVHAITANATTAGDESVPATTARRRLPSTSVAVRATPGTPARHRPAPRLPPHRSWPIVAAATQETVTLPIPRSFWGAAHGQSMRTRSTGLHSRVVPTGAPAMLEPTTAHSQRPKSRCSWRRRGSITAPPSTSQGIAVRSAFLAISPPTRCPPGDHARPMAANGKRLESGAYALPRGRTADSCLRAARAAGEMEGDRQMPAGPMTGNTPFQRLRAGEEPYAMGVRARVQRCGRADRALRPRLQRRRRLHIAEMASYPDRSLRPAPVDLSPFPEVLRWRAAIAGRPATRRAYALTRQVNPAAG